MGKIFAFFLFSRLPNVFPQTDHQTMSGKKEYICDECGRSFQSAQGLGGHRSSHARERVMCCISTPSLNHSLASLFFLCKDIETIFINKF